MVAVDTKKGKADLGICFSLIHHRQYSNSV